MEHRKLCEVVEFADKMLRLPMFGMVSVYLPLICFNFYLVVNSSPGHKFVSKNLCLQWALESVAWIWNSFCNFPHCWLWTVDLPVLLYWITYCILEAILKDLHQKISLLRPITLDLTAFRMEHRKLCEVVEFADRMLRLSVFEVVSVYPPLICFNFYLVVNSSPGHEFVSHISTLIFFFCLLLVLW